jgi:hypothetical protein
VEDEMRALVWLLATGCLVPDAVVEAYVDRDGDGEATFFYEGGTDCDDADPRVGSDQAEVCDGVDNDCDGSVDEDGDGAVPRYRDADGDGFGTTEQITSCEPVPGYADAPGDCKDDDPLVNPTGVEVCGDGIDNDCDGGIDDRVDGLLWAPDRDEDGWGGDEVPVTSCEIVPGYAAALGDCDDTEPDVHPGAVDLPYDGVDADCDDADDYDVDRDGNPFPDDCDDDDPTVFRGADDPPYDGVDADCDGWDDFDADRDGWVSAAHGGADCDDGDPARHPVAVDVPYDGVDQDCDPRNDDDVDLDGVVGGPGGADCDDGDPDVWVSCATCGDADGDEAFAGCDAYTRVPEDCDDTDADVRPGAPERFEDGVDQDCDGSDLTLGEAHGLFVAPGGMDHAACGTLADPCATPQHAVVAAATVGKVVFVAEGTYGPLDTSVSVFGGFDAFTWARDGVTLFQGGMPTSWCRRATRS